MGQVDAMGILMQLAASAIILLTSIPIHEVSHGFVAYLLGDPTAKNAGRLTLNPLQHFDLFGAIALFLAGVGWAKPVPINPNYFKHPKRDIALVSLAGPLSNGVMAFISMIIYKILWYISLFQSSSVLNFFLLVFGYAVSSNILLMVFNLLPIPPNDGFKIIGAFLPDRTYYKMLQYEQYGMILIVVLIISGVLNTPLSLLQEGGFHLLDTLTKFVDIVMRAILI